MKNSISYSDFFKKGDIFLYLILVFILVVLFPFNKKGNIAKIYVDGKKIKEIELLQDTIITFEGYKGPFIVEIRDGKIKMKDSVCPLKLCIKQGYISKKGESIVCLPNRVTIEIVGGDLDAISR